MAVQLFRHRDQDPSVDDNALVTFAQEGLPVTEEYDGGRLLTRVNGRRMITPLVLVLLAIGSTDILFALDSIPAVFGVTEETFIVFAAKAFALLGLRPLFFLVTGLLDRLVYLSTGLSLILAFIGAKLVLHWGHLQNPHVPEISTGASLVVIAVVLGITTLASLTEVRRNPTGERMLVRCARTRRSPRPAAGRPKHRQRRPRAHGNEAAEVIRHPRPPERQAEREVPVRRGYPCKHA